MIPEVRFVYSALCGLNEQHIFIYWFCAYELLTALFMQQFNIAIAAIVIATFYPIAKENDEKYSGVMRKERSAGIFQRVRSRIDLPGQNKKEGASLFLPFMPLRRNRPGSSACRPSPVRG